MIVYEATKSEFITDVFMDNLVSNISIHYEEKIRKLEVTKNELSSQFRCDGSDGYMAWVDDVLQIRETVIVRIKLLKLILVNESVALKNKWKRVDHHDCKYRIAHTVGKRILRRTGLGPIP